MPLCIIHNWISTQLFFDALWRLTYISFHLYSSPRWSVFSLCSISHQHCLNHSLKSLIMCKSSSLALYFLIIRIFTVHILSSHVPLLFLKSYLFLECKLFFCIFESIFHFLIHKFSDLEKKSGIRVKERVETN